MNLDWFFNLLPILKEEKDPTIAFLLGVFFGSLGLGIYLRSFLDFLGPSIFLIVAVISSSNIILIPGFIITGIYGFLRVLNSNQRLNRT